MVPTVCNQYSINSWISTKFDNKEKSNLPSPKSVQFSLQNSSVKIRHEIVNFTHFRDNSSMHCVEAFLKSVHISEILSYTGYNIKIKTTFFWSSCVFKLVENLKAHNLERFLECCKSLILKEFQCKLLKHTYFRNDSKGPAISEPNKKFCASNIKSIQK